MLTRPSPIAVVRRLFKMGLKSVERRLKTLRRLFARSAKILWPMLKNADAYFPFFHFYYIFTLARAARKIFMVESLSTPKNGRCLKTLRRLFNFDPAEKWPMLIYADGNSRPTSSILKNNLTIVERLGVNYLRNEVLQLE